MDHEVDELESAQLSFIIACRLVPRVLPGYPGERPTEAKRRFVDVCIGSSEFALWRVIGSFQFFHHTGASDRQGPGRLVSRMGLRRGRPARAVTGWDGFCSKVVFELLSV